MTWTMPLEASTSAVIIIAVLPGAVILHPEPTLLKVRSPLAVVTTWPSLRAPALMALPTTVWSIRIWVSRTLSAMMLFKLGTLANAASFGAKMVNGPLLESVATYWSGGDASNTTHM